MTLIEPQTNLVLIPQIAAFEKEATASATNDWLLNDDPNLFDNHSLTPSDLCQVDYDVNQLILHCVNNEYYLSTSDNRVRLQNGDTIKIVNQVYKVQLNEINNEAPKETHAQSLDEILRQRQQGVSKQETLKFLYDDKETAIDTHSEFITNQSRIGESVSNILPVNSNQSARMQAASSTVLPLTEGNVLNDLDINEEANSITHRALSHNKSSYDEQSPADILDEYLNEKQHKPQVTTMDDNLYTKTSSNKAITNKVSTIVKRIIG